MESATLKDRTHGSSDQRCQKVQNYLANNEPSTHGTQGKQGLWPVSNNRNGHTIKISCWIVMKAKKILIIGTYDTKNAELAFLAERIRDLGGDVLTMDVSVLGDPEQPTDISKHDVAAAAGSTIDQVIAAGDENKAFRIMSRGAARLVADAYRKKNFDGMIALGGTMGTWTARKLYHWACRNISSRPSPSHR